MTTAFAAWLASSVENMMAPDTGSSTMSQIRYPIGDSKTMSQAPARRLL